ncbi:amphoterin-induced protein 1-like [Gadus morhua]|uniref:Amphoterin-induced protein 1-like n=1 Tax=Gadus morhua TaxID=8049 RepID=A0A8C5CQT8_GADMO|nr:amphoterin-induced protein 1-like [Gadus morhua]
MWTSDLSFFRHPTSCKSLKRGSCPTPPRRPPLRRPTMRDPRSPSPGVPLPRRYLAALPLVLLIASVTADAQFMSLPLNSRTVCVCASNIVSCSQLNLTSVPYNLPSYAAVLDLSFNLISRLRADWTQVSLCRLHTLHLNHNGLTFLSSEAFAHVTQLRYLDLSSNGLRILEELIFEPLEHLEVLLLYNNHISQIDRTAFSGLACLQKLYLSGNQISRFPLEVVKERGRLETLSLLDVSSNRIKALPLAELQALPAWIKNDLYFHRNPLPCSCELHGLLALWDLQRFSSASDFREEHTCLVVGVKEKEKVAVLDLSRVHLNCSEVKVVKANAYLGQYLLLDCDTRQRGMLKTWALPENVTVSRADKSALLLPGGGLQIGPLKADDSGVYLCHATSDAYNETLHITVEVFNATLSGGLESIKTAYTTLVGCLFSVVMVLIYLYLTPCPCACCPGHGLTAVSGADDSLRSSTVSVCQMHEETGGKHDGDKTDKNFLNRQQQQQQQHTGFLGAKDPAEQNGRLNPIGEEEEEWHGENGARRGSDADSVSSVCSGTPMVV